MEQTLKSIRRRRLVEKCVYVASVGSICLLTHGVLSAQFIIPYFYTISAPMVIAWRIASFLFTKRQLLLLDFCYFGNYMFLLFIWIMPQDSEIFCVLFTLANGPLLWSVLLFRNSLVFHSMKILQSAYIHLLPCILSFTIRWYPGRASRLWHAEFVPKQIEWSYTWMVAVPLACYILHNILHTVLLRHILKPSDEYITVYRNMTQKPKSFLFRYFNSVGPRHRFKFYTLNHWIFSFFNMVSTILCYNSFTVHCWVLLLAVLLATYNGSCYYLEKFSHIERQRHLNNNELKQKPS